MSKTDLKELTEALLEIIPKKDLDIWLHAPNKGFGGKTPWSLIKGGKCGQIWQMIHQVREGTFA